MNQKEQIKNKNSASKLQQFSLGFEYDKTLQQLKHDVRVRTLE
jgi:hypothetical protein